MTTASSPKTTSSAAGNDQAATQITQDWSRFFDSRTPADQKAALLQNGDQFAPYIQQMAQSPLAQGVTAQVSKVQVQGQTAAVTYSVLAGGQPVLKDQTGQAVLQNGTWKVGTGSFCSLLALQGSVPPQCGTSSGSASPTAPAPASTSP